VARVEIKELWSYVDTSGAIIGNLKLINAEDFSDDLARVRDKAGCGIYK
jgi:hypothetical protein